MEFFLAVVVGALINLLFGLNESFGKPEFKWVRFLKENSIATVLNLVCGAVIVWFRDDLAAVLPITKLTALFLGSSGQFVFKKLAKVFDKNVDTYVGIGNGKDT